MASIAFPSLAKKATLSDGTTYGYVASAPATSDKPTFLLLHGYPSSCYDWRHQIASLSAAGFGVIAPDLLGYGDTDSPEDVAAYRMITMSQHMAEILDREGVSSCVAVGHDWGCGLLSRLATYIPTRLLGVVFVSVGYLEPGLVWDIDAFIKQTRELLGYETYGYWLWHNTAEAIQDCEEHPASTFNLLYPADPADWKKHFAPVGKAADYVRSGKLDALPSWYNLTEYTTRDRILAIKGYQGPLNWYKAGMRGVNIPDEAAVSEQDRFCSVPTLLVVSDQDYVTRADMQTQNSQKWVKKLRVETLDCGHWIQLERPAELQKLFQSFAAELTAGPSTMMDEPPLGSSESLEGGTAKRKRRGGTRRKTVTDSYTCKARHIRCDEQKPNCGNCQRLNLTCRLSDFITQSAWCVPSTSTSEEAPRDQQDDPAVIAGKGPTTGPGIPSPRPVSVWDVFNICLPEGGSDGSPMASTSSLSPTPAVVLESLPLPPPQMVPFNAETAHLLAIYQSGVATWMDIFDHSCTYQREIARRCLTSELVMRSVCAFTAKHLSLLPSGAIWSAVAGDYYGNSLRMLIRYLNSDSLQDDALTATMLLCSYEMIAAHGHEHQRHFYGAMVLIMTRGVNALSLGTDRANFWIYIRHEITVALVNEVPLQISPELWNVRWPEGEIEEDALGNRLLCLLGRAINVVYRLESQELGHEERETIYADAATWLGSLPFSSQGVKYGDLDDHGFGRIYFAVPAAAAAMMWYHLLHILLYAEPTPQHSTKMSQVQYHATEIANIALSDVHQSVRSFSAQALFFAAKHISGIGKKTTLWTLLDDIEVRHGFSTRSRVKQLQGLVEAGL